VSWSGLMGFSMRDIAAAQRSYQAFLPALAAL
jgi:hypothetical protein